MEGGRERAPKEELEQPSDRGRHYFAALREAGTLVVVFVSIDHIVAGFLPLAALVLLAYIDGVLLPRREARRAREAAEKRRIAAQSAEQDGPAQAQGTAAR